MLKQMIRISAGPSTTSHLIPTSPRRWLTSTSTTTEPPPGLQAWINTITSRPPTIHTDTLDALRASHLLRTLPTRQHLDHIQLQDGDTLAHGHHMIYFQPETMLRNLGPDGSSPEYNAPPPYTRRMWAGGSISWPHPSRGLKIGQTVKEERSIDEIEWKKGMVFFHQKREITPDSQSEAGVKEIRTHVFRQPTSSEPAKTDEVRILDSPPPDLSFTFTPSSALLFRYSALTFNAHRIHYDHPHTLAVEYQPNLLVHGPLTATLLIELAAREGVLSEFNYRAVSPIVVDKRVELVGWFKDQGRELELQAVQEGRVGMKASAKLYR